MLNLFRGSARESEDGRMSRIWNSTLSTGVTGENATMSTIASTAIAAGGSTVVKSASEILNKTLSLTAEAATTTATTTITTAITTTTSDIFVDLFSSNHNLINFKTFLFNNNFNITAASNRFYNQNFTYNDTYLYLTCPSIHMPMGNLISMILYTIVCIVGIFGNSLVIYVVLRFSKMQTVTNMYILNLAIADQCFLIGIPFLITTMHLGEWTFGTGMCKAYMVSTSITQFTSSIFLFIMSADRYIAICHPISSSRLRTPFISKIVSAIAWTTSVLIMLPVMIYSNTVEMNKNKLSCNIMWPEASGTGHGTTFTLYSLILGFAIPLTLILGFYYLVIRKLQTVGPKTKSKEKKRSHRKVTKLVLTVITVYVLCWLPYWILQVALINSPPDICKSRLEITVFVLVGCLGYSNSAMNPILYAFLSDNFKKSFFKACTCAAGKDVNAQLQIENSFFPKFGKGSRSGSEKMMSKSKQKTNKNMKKCNDTGNGCKVVEEGNGNAAGDGIDVNKNQGVNKTMTNVVSINDTHHVTITPMTINTTPVLSNTTTNIAQPRMTENESSHRPPVLHTDL